MPVSSLASVPEDTQESTQSQGKVRRVADLAGILEKYPAILEGIPDGGSIQRGTPEFQERSGRRKMELLAMELLACQSQMSRMRPVLTPPSGWLVEGILEQVNQRHDSTLRERFERLAAEWKTDHMFTSSPTEVALHDSYQRIIAMGPAALPFILSDLSDKQAGHWFWALQAISDEDPVPIEHRGLIDEMCEDWRQWGREQGYSC